MITGSSEMLQGITVNNMCAEHKAPLTVAWSAEENTYYLRCGEGHPAEAVTKIPSPAEAFRQGGAIPKEIEHGMARKQQRKAEAAGKETLPFVLNYLPKTDLATGHALNTEMIRALVEYGARYHLDAYRGHVALMYDEPYITIDGYLYHARNQKTPFRLESRPLTKEERLAMRLTDDDHGWKAELTIAKGNQYFVGIGIVTLVETTEESKKTPGQLRAPVVAAHPQQMAQKRAEWQALRRGFPIGETREESP